MYQNCFTSVRQDAEWGGRVFFMNMNNLFKQEETTQTESHTKDRLWQLMNKRFTKQRNENIEGATAHNFHSYQNVAAWFA